MTNHKSLLTVGALLVATLFVAASSNAGWGSRSINTLTLKGGAASVAGVVLTPGAYTFEVLAGHAELVRVTRRTGNRVMYTGFTNRVNRPAGTSRDGMLTFGEAPKGEPIPIVAWFPLGSSTGYEFQHR